MKEAWVSMTGESKLWLQVFPLFTIMTLMTVSMLLSGFYQELGTSTIIITPTYIYCEYIYIYMCIYNIYIYTDVPPLY